MIFPATRAPPPACLSARTPSRACAGVPVTAAGASGDLRGGRPSGRHACPESAPTTLAGHPAQKNPEQPTAAPQRHLLPFGFRAQRNRRIGPTRTAHCFVSLWGDAKGG